MSENLKEDQKKRIIKMMEDDEKDGIYQSECCGAYDSESGCCPFPETDSKDSN